MIRTSRPNGGLRIRKFCAKVLFAFLVGSFQIQSGQAEQSKSQPLFQCKVDVSVSEIEGQLSDMRDDRLLWAQTFDWISPVTADTATGVVRIGSNAKPVRWNATLEKLDGFNYWLFSHESGSFFRIRAAKKNGYLILYGSGNLMHFGFCTILN